MRTDADRNATVGGQGDLPMLIAVVFEPVQQALRLNGLQIPEYEPFGLGSAVNCPELGRTRR